MADGSVLAEPMEAEAIRTALRALQPELAFILEDIGLVDEVRAKIGSLGYSSVQVFSRVGDTAAEVRAFCTRDLGIQVDASSAHRVAHAKVVTAWHAAAQRVERRQAEEADRRVAELPRTLPKAQHLELERAFASTHRELPEREAPAKSYIEWRLEQVEDGELLAEQLKEVISKEEDLHDPWSVKMRSDGTLQLKRGRVESVPPETPEDLRRKFRIMAAAWEYVRLKHSSKAYLEGLGPEIWQEYVEWLLGEEVYQNGARNEKDEVIYRPSWATLLTYDFQVRRKALRDVNAGRIASIAEALRKARGDEVTRSKYFLTPVSLAAGAAVAREAMRGRQRSRTPRREAHRPLDGLERSQTEAPRDAQPSKEGPPPPPPGRGAKGGGKKGGRGRDGAAKGWRAGGSRTTPDGRFKCFRYQRGKCDGKCGMVHSCYVCNGPHPMKECTRRPPSGDPDRGGAKASQ